MNMSESVGGVVGSLTADRGVTMNPTRCRPPTCCPWTATTMFLPGDASGAGGPALGVTNTTVRACTFDRKITIVDSVKFPAPSVARPMIVMGPPAPDPGGNVTVTDWL